VVHSSWFYSRYDPVIILLLVSIFLISGLSPPAASAAINFSVPRRLSENRTPTAEIPFWPFFPLIFVKHNQYSPQMTEKMTQNGPPSLRRPFPGRLLDRNHSHRNTSLSHCGFTHSSACSTPSCSGLSVSGSGSCGAIETFIFPTNNRPC